MNRIEEQIQKVIDEMEQDVARAIVIRDRNAYNPTSAIYCACHAVVLALQPRIEELKQLLNDTP